MTLAEAIASADELCPNKIPFADKAEIVAYIDQKLAKEVLEKLEDFPPFNTPDYNPDTDRSRELLAPPPYDRIYPRYVAAQIHLRLHEQAHYNNELMVFESLLTYFKVYLYQKYHPKGASRYRVR